MDLYSLYESYASHCSHHQISIAWNIYRYQQSTIQFIDPGEASAYDPFVLSLLGFKEFLAQNMAINTGKNLKLKERALRRSLETAVTALNHRITASKAPGTTVSHISTDVQTHREDNIQSFGEVTKMVQLSEIDNCKWLSRFQQERCEHYGKLCILNSEPYLTSDWCWIERACFIRGEDLLFASERSSTGTETMCSLRDVVSIHFSEHGEGKGAFFTLGLRDASTAWTFWVQSEKDLCRYFLPLIF